MSRRILIIILLQHYFRQCSAQDFPAIEVYKITYYGFEWRNVAVHQLAIFTGNLFCTSSLITTEYAVTVASCFEFDRDYWNMITVAGSVNYNQFDPRAQIRKIRKLTMHDHFIAGVLGSDDIALLQLSSPLYLNFRVKTAVLPNRLMFRLNKSIVAGRYFLKTTPGHQLYGRLGRHGMRLLTNNETNFKCNCTENITDARPTVNDNGTVVSRVICFKYLLVFPGKNKSEELTCCKDVEGAPIMIGDTVTAIQHYAYYYDCRMYKHLPDYLQPESTCNGASVAAYLQLYHYRDWILSRIPPLKPARRNELLTTYKNPDLKPYLPLILHLSFLFIIILIFLICNSCILTKFHG